MIRFINRTTWWKLQNWGVRVFPLVLVHALYRSHDSIQTWFRNGGGVSVLRPSFPPVIFFTATFFLLVLVVRLSEFLGKRIARRAILLAFLIVDLAIGGVLAWGTSVLPPPQTISWTTCVRALGTLTVGAAGHVLTCTINGRTAVQQ